MSKLGPLNGNDQEAARTSPCERQIEDANEPRCFALNRLHSNFKQRSTKQAVCRVLQPLRRRILARCLSVMQTLKGLFRGVPASVATCSQLHIYIKAATHAIYLLLLRWETFQQTRTREKARFRKAYLWGKERLLKVSAGGCLDGDKMPSFDSARIILQTR